MVAWLGAGELLNLAADGAPHDAGTGSSSPSRASVLSGWLCLSGRTRRIRWRLHPCA